MNTSSHEKTYSCNRDGSGLCRNISSLPRILESLNATRPNNVWFPLSITHRNDSIIGWYSNITNRCILKRDTVKQAIRCVLVREDTGPVEELEVRQEEQGRNWWNPLLCNNVIYVNCISSLNALILNWHGPHHRFPILRFEQGRSCAQITKT